MKRPIDYFSGDQLREDLKGKTVRGGAVTGFAQALNLAISLAAVPLLARLLDPADFGLVAMVAVFTGFANMFVNAGLGMATVQKEAITCQLVSNLFWICTALGVAIALMVSLCSPAIAWLYGEPRLVAITLALALSFVFSGMTLQHQALLRRAMKFRSLAIAQITATFLGQGTGLIWAWQAQDQESAYWALVAIPIVIAASRMGMTWILCGWVPDFPQRGAGTRDLVVFGANLTGFSMLNYFSRNADNFLIGYWWGKLPLGYYDRAYKLFMLPLQAINTPLASVMVPALSRIADDPAKVQQAYLKVLRLLLATVVPALVAVSVTAHWWIDLALGPRFKESIPIFRWLAIAGIVQSIPNSCGWLFIAQDKTKELFRLAIIDSPVAIISFLVGLAWGPAAVAASFALTFLFVRTPILLWWMQRFRIAEAKPIIIEIMRALPLSFAVGCSNLFVVRLLPLDATYRGISASVLVSFVIWSVFVASTYHGRTVVREIGNMVKSMTASSPT